MVGDKHYLGDAVKDGFFDSISNLKTVDTSSLNDSEYFQQFSLDYENILEICKSGPPIPAISEKDAFDIMQRMKPNVNDHNSITINHFLYAGPPGWKHFHLLLNCLINDVSNTCIE